MQNAKEQVFQQDIINHLVSNGWTLGEASGYDQKHALHTEDLVAYLSETQPEQSDKSSRMHAKDAEAGLIRSVARKLDKKARCMCCAITSRIEA